MGWRRIASALVTAALVGVAPATTVAAAPTAGMPPMVRWYWSPPLYPGGHGGVTFQYGTQTVGLAFPASIGNPPNWSGFDNPQPLTWYYQQDPNDPAGVGQFFFGQGVKYTPQLISTMNSEHFAPAMVGGVNPSGITTSTSTGTATKTLPPASTPATSQGNGQSMGTAPNTSTGTGESQTTSPPEPPVLQHPTPPPNYHKVLQADSQSLNQKQSAPKQDDTAVIAGAIAVVLAIAVYAVVRWRRRRVFRSAALR